MKNRYELRDEYAKHGIDFVYNDRTRESFLKIMGAPAFEEGVSGAQSTGWYRVSGGIKQAQDVETLSERAKDLYRKNYSDNSTMLKYLDNICSANEELGLNSKVKSWYLKAYPDDTMGRDLNPEITFNDIAEALNEGKDLRLVLGGYDSLVRERIFDMLSKVMCVSYDAVYNKWLAGDKEPNIVLDELAQKIARNEDVAAGFHVISIEACMDDVYGASIVQYCREEGLVAFAFSSVGVHEAISRPELVLAEIIRNKSSSEPPAWTELSESMLDLIVDSGFDMHFIEYDDDFWTETKANKIWDESVDKGLDGVVRTGEDGCLITVYAGAMGSVNWANHSMYGKPCLENVFASEQQSLDKHIQEAKTKSVASNCVLTSPRIDIEPSF